MGYKSSKQESPGADDELEPAVLQKKAYIDKMAETIEHHHLLDEDPAPIQEKKLNAALPRIKKQGNKKDERAVTNVDLLLKRE